MAQKYRIEVVNIDDVTEQIMSSTFIYTDTLPVPMQINNIEVKEKITVINQITGNNDAVMVSGSNIQDGTVSMNNIKKSRVVFEQEFQTLPRVTLTFTTGSPPASNSFVTDISITGFSINFAQNVTTQIDWIAIERKK